MEDTRNDLGTTSEFPPTPPTGQQAQDSGKSGGVPLWTVFAAAAAVLAIAVIAALMWRASADAARTASLAEIAAQKVTLEQQVADLEARAAAAASTAVVGATSPATTAVAAPKPKPKPASSKQYCFVKSVKWSSAKGYTITVDYVQMLTGSAAAAAAAAAGEESPPPNDYFIANTNPKLRTFTIAKAAPVTVLGLGGVDATKATKISVGQFMDMMPGGVNPQPQWSNALYVVTVNGSSALRVDQFYLP
ncbi:MAG: hypothetical protein Q7W30_09140 [Coriobacteriia bacterium]|nr:hypothetical protein [Coriobacteriia bacterium]